MRRETGIIAVFGITWCLTGSAAGAEFDQITVRTSKPVTALNEVLTARPGDTVYVERSYGQPGARLKQPLGLKNTPAGRVVTLTESTDLFKARVDGVIHFCAGHTLRVRRTKVRKPGFYICLRDADGDGATFDEVRVVTMVMTVLKEERGRRKTATAFKRTYEIDPPARLSPKPYVLTRINPDGETYYQVSVTLKALSPEKATFVSEMRDHEGKRVGDAETFDIALTGAPEQTVTVLHPVRGEMVYRTKRRMDGATGSAIHEKRAAQLRILSTAQGRLTYRVARTFAPWRYAKSGKKHNKGGMIFWAFRPKPNSAPAQADTEDEVKPEGEAESGPDPDSTPDNGPADDAR